MNGPTKRLYQRIAGRMLEDLEANYHEVVLIPAGDPQHSEHKIRVTQSHNCDWYRKFAGLYTNCRGIGRKRMKRARTFILKSQTAGTLRRMIDGNFGRRPGRTAYSVYRRRPRPSKGFPEQVGKFDFRSGF